MFALPSFVQHLPLFAWLCSAAITAQTPQIGRWNSYRFAFNRTVIEQTADALVRTGLRDAGYTYVVIDDGWQAKTRGADGRLIANETKFPGGIPAIAEYVHQRKIKLGIYANSGIYTCGHYPGSWGFEEIDAQTFAEWGVDYLKYDNCGAFEGGTVSSQNRFGIMRDALRNSGRDIFYSMCQWGHQFPWFWADQIAHSFRVTGDITAKFSDAGADCACRTAYCLNTGYASCSVMTILRKMREIAPFQKPGAWLDMDMLEVGNGNMTLHQQRTHMSFWSALKSPLIFGANLVSLANETLAVLKHPGMIALSQDSLGKPALFSVELSHSSVQVWSGELSNDRTVVLLFNELAAVSTKVLIVS